MVIDVVRRNRMGRGGMMLVGVDFSHVFFARG